MKRMEIDVELDDGTEHRLKVNNVSMVAFDRTRIKRGWPSADEAPMAWATFIAWHHMKAAGLVDCTLEEFENTRCVVCRVVQDAEDAEAAEGDAVDPIPTTPAPPTSLPSDSPPGVRSPQVEFLG